jgi:hypothetical protein
MSCAVYGKFFRITAGFQEKELFWVNIYTCFNILFRNNLFVQLQNAKECFGRFFLFVFIFFQEKNFCSAKYLGIFQKIPDCFGCFDIGSKHRTKPKFFFVSRNKQKQTRNKSCFGLNRNFKFFISRTP